MKTRVYKTPLAWIDYCYVETAKEYTKVCNRFDVPSEIMSKKPKAAHTQILSREYEHENGHTVTNPLCIVWLLPTGDAVTDIPLLVHEAVHIKQQILEWVSEDACGSEVEAYIMQELVTNLLKEYNKHRS